LTCFRFDISPHIQLLKCYTYKNGLVSGHQAVCLVISHQSFRYVLIVLIISTKSITVLYSFVKQKYNIVV